MQPLCPLCLCGCFSEQFLNHKGTEDREVTQRRSSDKDFSCFGLKKMIRNGDVMVEGETLFTDQLESCFGKERSSEVRGVIMKYAKVPDDEFTLLIVQPEPNGGPPPPAVQEIAASAAI